MRKVLVILGSIILISIFGCASMEKGYQDNADQIRLQHLRYYGDLLEEYHAKTGKFPFQEEYDIPVYITIANDFQKTISLNHHRSIQSLLRHLVATMSGRKHFS